MEIKSARYDSSAISVDKCIQTDKPEFAFIGRSNVGKSSLINMLTGNQKLAMTSSTPGKTILINTLEIGEIQKVADRCAVFYDGRLIKLLGHDQIDEHTVMMYSTNAAQTMEE